MKTIQKTDLSFVSCVNMIKITVSSRSTQSCCFHIRIFGLFSGAEALVMFKSHADHDLSARSRHLQTPCHGLLGHLIYLSAISNTCTLPAVTSLNVSSMMIKRTAALAIHHEIKQIFGIFFCNVRPNVVSRDKRQ